MAKIYQQPGESKLRFTGTLTDLATAAKAAGRILGNADKIGSLRKNSLLHAAFARCPYHPNLYTYPGRYPIVLLFELIRAEHKQDLKKRIATRTAQ